MDILWSDETGPVELVRSHARVWSRSILIALIHLHTHNITHGDLDPINVLVTSAHLIVVSDFGSAVHRTGDLLVGSVADLRRFDNTILRHFAIIYTRCECTPRASIDFAGRSGWYSQFGSRSFGSTSKPLAVRPMPRHSSC